jgi:hypothetical protein
LGPNVDGPASDQPARLRDGAIGALPSLATRLAHRSSNDPSWPHISLNAQCTAQALNVYQNRRSGRPEPSLCVPDGVMSSHIGGSWPTDEPQFDAQAVRV